MLSKITIQDKFGNEGFYIFTDAIKPDQQKIEIKGIYWKTGEPVDIGGKTLDYWKWFVWFLDYRMWINDIEWDKNEQQRKQEVLHNMNEQRRRSWAKQEHDRIIDMGLDRSDAEGNL